MKRINTANIGFVQMTYGVVILHKKIRKNTLLLTK